MRDNHPYYRTLDYGEPRLHPDDYRRAGLEPLPPRNYAGHGPRRADECIFEDVCRLLTEAPDIDASGMEVEVKNAEVILHGTAPDHYMRRAAEDVAWDVSGVRDVHNRVKVQREESGGPVLTAREAGANLSGSTARS